MKQGDIYLVQFSPGVGHEYQKLRPAIVVENEQMITNANCVNIMALSSKIDKQCPDDVFIPKDDKNGLDQDSIIVVDYVPSFDKSRFLGKIGEVNSPILRRVRGYLRKHFLL